MGNSFRNLLFCIVGWVFLFSSLALASPKIIAEVALNPAGDFKIEISEVKGEATIDGDTVRAERIVAELKGLKTGMTLRDKHAKDKYLEVQKFPVVELLSAIGKGGKGKGRIRMRGIEKDVEGTYRIEGNELKAVFAIKLSDFKITGIKYMGIGVEDVVKVLVTVPAKKK